MRVAQNKMLRQKTTDGIYLRGRDLELPLVPLGSSMRRKYMVCFGPRASLLLVTGSSGISSLTSQYFGQSFILKQLIIQCSFPLMSLPRLDLTSGKEA